MGPYQNTTREMSQGRRNKKTFKLFPLFNFNFFRIEFTHFSLNRVRDYPREASRGKERIIGF